jgi:hypothetical protein
MFIRGNLAALAACALLLCGSVAGQVAPADRGVIEGSVVDSSGATIGGVRVELQRGFSSLTAETGADGRYRLTGVSPGTYRLIATKQGFAVFSTEVVLQAGHASELTISLSPAAVTETVTVSAVADSYEAQTSTTATSVVSHK